MKLASLLLASLALFSSGSAAMQADLQRQRYTKSSNPDENDFFGHSVAVSGGTLVVGAYGEDSSATGVNGDQNDNSAPGSGAAYVFNFTGSGWVPTDYLKASNTDQGDEFGFSVAISGDTIVVGARGEDGDGGLDSQNSNARSGSGAVYVFEKEFGAWNQTAYLKELAPGAGDAFGYSVATNGDRILIGAPNEDSERTAFYPLSSNDLAPNAGAAYVFNRSGPDWIRGGYLKATNAEAGDLFGTSVAISGEFVLIGAPGEDSMAQGVNGDEADNSRPSSGAAYLIENDPGNPTGFAWVQRAYFKASNTDTNDEFGRSVALSMTSIPRTVLIGSPFEASGAMGVDGDEDDNAWFGTGAAYVFEGMNWAQTEYLKSTRPGSLVFSDNPGGSFGWSVAIDESADRLAIGAWTENTYCGNWGTMVGAVHTFEREAGAWVPEERLIARYGGQSDRMSYSVAASSGRVVAGALAEDGSEDGGGWDDDLPNCGAVYTFDAGPTSATVTCRNVRVSVNPYSYFARAAILGEDWELSVDLSQTGHTHAQVLGYTGDTNVTMNGGQALLVSGMKLFSLPLRTSPAEWTVPIPLDPSLEGVAVYTQAVHIFGVAPFELTNAQDLVIGY